MNILENEYTGLKLILEKMPCVKQKQVNLTSLLCPCEDLSHWPNRIVVISTNEERIIRKNF